MQAVPPVNMYLVYSKSMDSMLMNLPLTFYEHVLTYTDIVKHTHTHTHACMHTHHTQT